MLNQHNFDHNLKQIVFNPKPSTLNAADARAVHNAIHDIETIEPKQQYDEKMRLEAQIAPVNQQLASLRAKQKQEQQNLQQVKNERDQLNGVIQQIQTAINALP